MTGDDFHKDFIAAGLEHVSRDAQRALVDSLACQFHNFGHNLGGNTQESDLDWFARTCWCEDTNRTSSAWDALPESERKAHRERAATAIALLPRLMARIAHRAQNWAQALNALDRANREDERQRLRSTR